MSSFSLLLSFPVFAGSDIKLLFAGDTTLGGVYHSLANDAQRNPGFSFQKLAPRIAASDYFILNLETTVTEHEGKIPKKFNFKMGSSDLAILAAGRVNLVSLANNHTFDYGTQGLFDTLDALDGAGIAHVGAGRTLSAARTAHRATLKGKTFAFLAYGNMNEHAAAEQYVAYRHTKHVVDDIQQEKLAGVDYVVVFFHWGVERDTVPRAQEILLAHTAVDAGADIIVGAHPHVPQPLEIYKGKPIAYSLGNFIFGGNRRGIQEGLMVEATIHTNGAITMLPIPLIIDPQKTHYQPYEK